MTENNLQNETDKFDNQNKIYDFCSFSILGLCIFEILYCLFVKYDSYSYYVITLLGISIIALYFYTNSLKIDNRSNFSNFAKDYLTNDFAKSFAKITFKFITKALCYLALLYPFSVLLLWILSSLNVISGNFIQHLPYCYHPNCDGFSIFVMCIIYMIITTKLVQAELFGWGSIIGAILLYTFFDQKLFDTFADISSFIGVIAIILTILWIASKVLGELANNSGAQGNATYSGSSQSVSPSNNTNLEEIKREQKRAVDEMKREQKRVADEMKREQERAEEEQKRKTIGNAKQQGNVVIAYNVIGSVLFQRSGELVGYTSTTVSVKLHGSNTVITYGADGNVLYQR